MTRLLREPLFHFFVIGAALFGLFAIFDDTQPVAETQTINVSQEDVRRLAAEFEATWRRTPTDAELENLIDHLVREEVYVREARALGLDRGDAAVRQRLRQKMAFLITSAASAATPSEEVLRAYFEENSEAYQGRSRISFEQVFLGEAPGEDAVRSALAALRGGGDPDQIGQRTLLPPAMRRSSKDAIDATFGRGLFAALENMPTDEWGGPAPSGFGVHLVRVTERQEAEIPEFATVREQVLRDWQRAEAERFEADAYQRLVDRYDVEVEQAGTE